VIGFKEMLQCSGKTKFEFEILSWMVTKKRHVAPNLISWPRTCWMAQKSP
jgi:hypothetical protein